MNPTILVLGGGMGGVHAARELSRKIGNENGINLAKILVFERKRQSLYAPSLTWLMIGKRQPDEIYRELGQIEMNGIEVIAGEIEQIDPAAKTITSNGKIYRGDYIIASLGVEQSPLEVLNPSAHNFYTVEGAQSFFRDLVSFNGKKITVLIPSLPYKSPVAPYEAAMLIDHYLREKGSRPEVEVHLYTPEDQPMPFANPEISARVLELFRNKSIHFHPNHQFVEKNQGQLVFKTGQDETVSVEPGLVAYTPKQTAPKILADAGLVGASGWVEPDPETLETGYENVYVIGDVIELSADKGHTMPKAGIFAKHQAEVVAHNIARKMANKPSDKTFRYKGSYILDHGDQADKISGDFEPGGKQTAKEGALRHWEKTISEKVWFLNNF